MVFWQPVLKLGRLVKSQTKFEEVTHVEANLKDYLKQCKN